MPAYGIKRPDSAFSLRTRYRRPRQRADLHLKWIRTLPCAICGQRRNVHAAHLRAPSRRYGKLASGLGEKPDDSWTIPLCLEHHLLGEEAQHSDKELAFWERHSTDPFALALALWRASGDDDVGFIVLAETRR